MEKEILTRLTTLGHPKRMAVFRLLVRRFPDAVAAGDVARALGLKSSTLSVYLSALTRAGLITQTRHKTSLRYQARLEAVREVTDYLLLDCCRGRPELCPPPAGPQANAGQKTSERKQNVMFICTGNSARSIMAESLLRHLAGVRFNAFSAGTRPAQAPNPLAIALLQGQGHDLAGLRSKNVEEFLGPEAPQMDFTFTVCDSAANQDCPLWPGHPISGHWGIPDPAAVTGTLVEKQQAFARAYDQMHARIQKFIDLDPAPDDMATLQSGIDEIANMPKNPEV